MHSRLVCVLICWGEFRDSLATFHNYWNLVFNFVICKKNAKPQASKNKQQKTEKNVLYSLNYILEPQNKNVYNEKDLIRILTPQ